METKTKPANKPQKKFFPNQKRQGKLVKKQPFNPTQGQQWLVQLAGRTDPVEPNISNDGLRKWLAANKLDIGNVQLSSGNPPQLEAVFLKGEGRWATASELISTISKGIAKAINETSQDIVKDPKAVIANPALGIGENVLPIAKRIQDVEAKLGEEPSDEKELKKLRDERIFHYLELAETLLKTNVSYAESSRSRFNKTREITASITAASRDAKYVKLARATIHAKNEKGEPCAVSCVFQGQNHVRAFNHLVNKGQIHSVRLTVKPNQNEVSFQEVLASTDGIHYEKLPKLIAQVRAKENALPNYRPLQAPITIQISDIEQAIKANRIHSNETSLPQIDPEAKIMIERAEGGYARVTENRPHIPTSHSVVLVRIKQAAKYGGERTLVYQTRTKTILDVLSPDDPEVTALRTSIKNTKIPSVQEPSDTEIPYDPIKEEDPRIQDAQKLASELITGRPVIVVHEDFLRPAQPGSQVQAFFPQSAKLAHHYAKQLTGQEFNNKPLFLAITDSGLTNYKNNMQELIAHELAHALIAETNPSQAIAHSLSWAKLASVLVAKATLNNPAMAKLDEAQQRDYIHELVGKDTIQEIKAAREAKLAQDKKEGAAKDPSTKTNKTEVTALKLCNKYIDEAIDLAKTPGPIDVNDLIKPAPTQSTGDKNRAVLTR